MSLEKSVGSMEFKGLISLVMRGSFSLGGTEKVERIASWSDKAGKV